jgi:UPF0755 protein
MRYLPFAATAAALVMTALAAWQVTKSPGSVDDVAPFATPRGTPGPAVRVRVEAGESPEEIGRRLEDMGVIHSATQFEVLVALMGYDGVLQAGEYEFDLGTPALETVYRIRRGQVSARSVTVVEGWRLEEIADAVAEQGVPRDEFLAAARAGRYDFGFLSGLSQGERLEGYLFPATYPIGSLQTPEDVVSDMLQAFALNVPAEVEERAADLGLSLHEVVTIASIIEREARVPDERPVMAQVFLSRLRLGISLDADPTVQYAVADEESIAEFGYWKQELTRADLETGSPYNTYRYYGLPPGPICSPGLGSILAVVDPADTSYLYFVARPDGSHAFAETLEEHLENVEEYRGQ